MNTDFQKILQRIAAENHTTPEEVYREMQIAIDAAYASDDPEVRKNWSQFPSKETVHPRRCYFQPWLDVITRRWFKTIKK
jgi:hypothetical protein